MKDERVYLRHILDAIELIEKYAAGKTFGDVAEDHLLQDGIIRQLQVVGEASRRVPDQFQAAHPEVVWADIIGMRHVPVHDYLDVDLAEVWRTVRGDLPALKEQVLRIPKAIEGAC